MLGAEDRGRGWGCDASVQNWEFLSSSGEASKSRGRVFRAFSHWAMIPPGQPSLFLLSGSGGAAGSKAKRPCTSATRSPGSLPTPAPHFLAQSCSAFPGCRVGGGGEQDSIGRVQTCFRKARQRRAPLTTAYHGLGALTRRTGASRGSLSAAGWASPSGKAAASCRPGRAWSGAALLCGR